MKKKPGIYRILNSLNGKFYIGSAVSVLNRVCVHKHQLKNNAHHNKKLQRSWNKYGGNNFIFEVIEYVKDKENLLIREQFWITKSILEGNVIYNICKIAGSSLGRVFSQESRLKMSASQAKRKHTEESKEKMSQNRKGKKFSELHKQRLSQALTGRKQSVEAKEKMKSAWVLRKAKGIKRNNLGRFIISEPQEEFDQRYAA